MYSLAAVHPGPAFLYSGSRSCQARSLRLESRLSDWVSRAAGNFLPFLLVPFMPVDVLEFGTRALNADNW
jgi:hypothetical protein